MPTQEGSRYQQTKDLDIKEIAKLIRQDIQTAYPNLKTSVRIDRYSGGQSIDIEILECDFEVINPTYAKSHFDPSGKYLDLPNIPDFPLHTEEASECLRDLQEILNQYNLDKSDTQSDYFEVRFYGHPSFSHILELESIKRAHQKAKDVVLF